MSELHVCTNSSDSISSVLVSQDGACDVIITSEGVKQGNFSSPNYPQVCIHCSHREGGGGSSWSWKIENGLLNKYPNSSSFLC